MAYVKQWAPRSYRRSTLRRPRAARRATACARARRRARRRRHARRRVDLAYLDPPYNQHRYFTNYHVWETLVAWDAPEHYGVACKRVDARDDVDQERVQPPSARCPTRSRA